MCGRGGIGVGLCAPREGRDRRDAERHRRGGRGEPGRGASPAGAGMGAGRGRWRGARRGCPPCACAEAPARQPRRGWGWLPPAPALAEAAGLRSGAGGGQPGRSRVAAGCGRSRRGSKPNAAFADGCVLAGAACNRPRLCPRAPAAPESGGSGARCGGKDRRGAASGRPVCHQTSSGFQKKDDLVGRVNVPVESLSPRSRFRCFCSGRGAGRNGFPPKTCSTVSERWRETALRAQVVHPAGLDTSDTSLQS